MKNRLFPLLVLIGFAWVPMRSPQAVHATPPTVATRPGRTAECCYGDKALAWELGNTSTPPGWYK